MGRELRGAEEGAEVVKDDPIHWKLRVTDTFERILCTSTKKERETDGAVVLKPVTRQGGYYDPFTKTFEICARCEKTGETLFHRK